nr:hypothetical protein [Oceanobacillus senegalensis]
MFGLDTSTWISNLQSAVFPEASSAVQVTSVVPRGKKDPDAGEQEKMIPGQLSVTVGSG